VSAATDLETGYIFDDVSIATLATVFVASLLNGSAVAAACGAIAASALLGLLYVVTRGGGLGLGDVKLGASIGASLGPIDGVASLALAFIFGGAYGALMLAIRRRSSGSIVRFAPFLAAGLICEGLYPCFH
jgi:leader peptidase (prepilin peptidase)/N-methyltransferase